MGAVAFLPQKFGRTQKHACTHLPAHHVGPLVAQHGQIAITVYPVLICSPYDGLRCRTHYKLLFEACVGVNDNAVAVGVVFQTVVGNYGTLFGKAFDMLGLAA
jgi:hypothetical protein